MNATSPGKCKVTHAPLPGLKLKLAHGEVKTEQDNDDTRIFVH